jgi:GTPase
MNTLLLAETKTALKALLDDPALPDALKRELEPERREIERFIEKLERSELHIAIFGRVSVGKSSLGNALLGQSTFRVSPLHGETTHAQSAPLPAIAGHPIVLIDTPGIDEIAGERREKLALDAARAADLVIVVVDADLTRSEFEAIHALHALNRPLLIALNKVDRYAPTERAQLLERLRESLGALLPPERVLTIAARPAVQKLIVVDANGRETDSERTPPPDLRSLNTAIERIVQFDGDQMKALSAGLYAAEVSDDIARRLIELKSNLGRALIRNYALGKGVAVALTPVPLADLAAAAASDVALIVHLSKLYGLPMTRTEALNFVGTVAAQLALLFGALWGVHAASSVLKGLTGGLSTALTAVVQGALAYYGAVVVGRATERYLENGKSWGDAGPKRVLADLIANLDRDSILNDAKAQIQARLKQRSATRS